MTQIRGDFLKDNPDINAFVEWVSDSTGEKCMPIWIQNMRDNRQIFKEKGWATLALQGKHANKTAIIIGASPALHKQLDTLKEIQEDSDFILCGLSSNLEFLLNNGIKPRYIITVDADISQGEFFDTIDMEKTKDITLIANIFAYPPMLQKWKGPLYFIALSTEDTKFEKKQIKWFGPLNGLGGGFPSLAAQFNIMAAIAILIFECKVLLFVGHELSFKEKDSTYYVDRKDPRDENKRFPHGDIYGNMVETTWDLLMVKYTLEGFLELISKAAWYFNCTEAGIFGITKRFPDLHIPWIHQLTLKTGIAQARHIMRTGQPYFTKDTGRIVVVPDMQSRVSLMR